MAPKQILDQLVSFRSEANPDTFNQIFGRLGPHLWSQFSHKFGFDVVVFYARLDDKNRALFIEAIGGDNGTS